MRSFVLLLLIFISNSCSLPTQTAAGEFFWFPNPREEGGLIKAYLRGGPDDTVNRIPSVGDIHYYLYTKENPDTPDEILVGDISSIDNSHFNKALPIKFVSHGFGGTHMDGCPRSIRAAYLRLPEAYNVITLDWEQLALNPLYHIAANNTILVGERTAELIEFLVANDYTKLDDIHFVGHSLGAHVGGNTGFALKIGKIGRITGLDPALPLFGLTTDEFRLDPTDAQFVDVMHTAAGTLLQGGLAFVEPRGHVDYYPNSGTKQPNCGADAFGSCSHGRTCSYFEESILATEGEFTSCRCTTWVGFANEECLCKIKTPMGAHVDVNTATGTYYLHTNGQSPFARGDDMSPPPPTVK